MKKIKNLFKFINFYKILKLMNLNLFHADFRMIGK
jgi:hypothetical protein